MDPTPLPTPLPTATPESQTAIVEIPAGSLEGVDIALPGAVGELAVFGLTVGAALAIVERAAHKWLKYSPVVRRLFPKWFAGDWDEYVDSVARFIKGSDVRFIKTPQAEIKSALKDPEVAAKLLTSGAKLSAGPEEGIGRSSVSHVVIQDEKKEEYPNQKLWDLLRFNRQKG